MVWFRNIPRSEPSVSWPLPPVSDFFSFVEKLTFEELEVETQVVVVQRFQLLKFLVKVHPHIWITPQTHSKAWFFALQSTAHLEAEPILFHTASTIEGAFLCSHSTNTSSGQDYFFPHPEYKSEHYFIFTRARVHMSGSQQMRVPIHIALKMSRLQNSRYIPPGISVTLISTHLLPNIHFISQALLRSLIIMHITPQYLWHWFPPSCFPAYSSSRVSLGQSSVAMRNHCHPIHPTKLWSGALTCTP